jgi:RNA polymerase sigma-70 factor (ECF subfamily)
MVYEHVAQDAMGPITIQSPTPEQIETATLDADRLDAFVRDHHDRLVRLARLVCRDPSEASDAVQSALLQAWKRRGDLRDHAALRAWLDRIVVREAIRQDRRRRSPLGRLFRGPTEIAVEPIDRPSSMTPAMTELRLAFETLPADQRAALTLHLHYGYTVAETAAILEAPVETVRSRLRLGRERLRLALGDER